MWRLILESTAIGTLIGAIPGTGASIAVFLSYERAKKISTAPSSKLDPVGSGATQLRTSAARTLLNECNITIIRGNASET